MGRKKKFIDSKVAQTFKLMSKPDYNGEQEESPTVLAPLPKKGEKVERIVRFQDDYTVEVSRKDDRDQERTTQLKGIASDRREMEDGERREIEVEIDDDDSDGRWEEVEEEEEVEERQQKSSSTSASSDAQKKKASGSAEEEAEEEEAVRRIDYTDVEGDDPELGAYGLWNDGYDYSKHLRTVGGGMIIEANDAPDLTKGMLAVIDENGNIIEVDEDQAARYVDKDLFDGLFPDEEGEDVPEEVIEEVDVMHELLGDKDEEGRLLPSVGKKILRRLKGRVAEDENDDDFFDFEAFLQKKAELGITDDVLNDKPKSANDVFQRQFEEALKMYDDDEWGEGRPEEDVGGIHEIDEFGDVIDGFLEEQARNRLIDRMNEADRNIKKEDGEVSREEAIEAARIQLSRMEAQGDEEEFEEEEVVEEDQWDCETILSTYSNLENHPTVIGEVKKKKKPQRIVLSEKTGIPKGVFPQKGGPLKAIQENDNQDEKEREGSESEDDSEAEEDVIFRDNLGVRRNKEETTEEKKARKQAMKEAKKERRMKKKNFRSEFKEEEKRQKKVAHPMTNLRVMPMY